MGVIEKLSSTPHYEQNTNSRQNSLSPDKLVSAARFGPQPSLSLGLGYLSFGDIPEHAPKHSSALFACPAVLSIHRAHCPDFHYNIPMSDLLQIAGRSFRSRLIVGTGKYKSFQETARALEASGAEMVTVAVRRVNLDRSKESLLDYIDPKKYFLLPNTAGCYTADEAIRAARLGREVGLSDWVKLEVIGDQATLYPDVQATLEATRVLVKEGFTVLPYTSDDIVFAKRLIDAGAATIMPLGAPIGSGMGIQNQAHIRILREMITGVPLIVDAGVGTASDAAIAMELGADAVLMNTGIANAQDPVLMAEAMKHAVLAGRQAYLSGRMPRKLYATASSPLEGVVR
jgi:thiazole synthase